MKTGVIGLGAMGTGMAQNLDRAGHLYRIWNRTRSKAEALAARSSATVADSPASLARECELIIICVSRDEDVLELINGMAAHAGAGTVVADTSTVSAATAQTAAALLAEQDVAFLDCPVSGGVEGATKGTLAMMVGGDDAVLQSVRDALGAIAASITLVGPTGSGQACKAVNQILCAGINQAVTEGLAFGEALGLDMDTVVDVVSRGAAGNWFLDHRGRTMLAGSYDTGFKVNLHHKDLQICLDMAQQAGDIALPLVTETTAMYERLMADGYGDEDISAMYRLKRPGSS